MDFLLMLIEPFCYVIRLSR